MAGLSNSTSTSQSECKQWKMRSAIGRKVPPVSSISMDSSGQRRGNLLPAVATLKAVQLVAANDAQMLQLSDDNAGRDADRDCETYDIFHSRCELEQLLAPRCRDQQSGGKG